MKELSALTALIIDPHAGMRGSMHNMLNLCDLTKIDHATSSGTAIRQLQNKAYDIIICEYDLGDGQDGQQLLEDLRNNKIITLWAIFIIVTAERSLTKVVSAIELMPTDYILKPFTADALLDRIAKAIEKRSIFFPIYQAMERSNLRKAITVCTNSEVGNPRYISDLMRLRAELHVMLGELVEAEAIYSQLSKNKMLGWARLGLARIMFMQEHFIEAEEILKELVAENGKFLDAYDWLAKAHEMVGRLAEAKSVLENAIAISPHAVRRLRKLGEIALETGDMDTAERAFQQVVAKAKYSEFRDPEDHVRWIKTLVAKGSTEQAATVVRDLEKSLGSLKKTPACRAFSNAMIHERLGDAARTSEQLNVAVIACRESIGLSSGMKMELAKSCLQNNLDEEASEVMLEVMGNATNSVTMAKAMAVFEQAGRQDLAESTAKESRERVVELVTSGVDKARQGDYRGAVASMMSALSKLPDNPQVVFNAALAVLKCLENLGWDEKLGAQGRLLIETSRRLDPTDLRLTSLSDLYQGILKKYDVRSVRTSSPGPSLHKS